MEALALHDFKATAEDELSFRKGTLLRVLNMESDKHWFMAESEGREGLIPSNYIQLSPQNWYYSRLSRSGAESILEEQEKGAFIVRVCESSPEDFSLSVKCEKDVQHFKVLRDGRGKFFLWVVKFRSLNELVKHHFTASVTRSEDVRLKDFVCEKYLVQALHDFVANEIDELELRRGDVFHVTDKVDVNWWAGRIGDRKGYFPAKFVVQFKPKSKDLSKK